MMTPERIQARLENRKAALRESARAARRARANQRVVRALVDFVKVVRAEWPDIEKKDLA